MMTKIKKIDERNTKKGLALFYKAEMLANRGEIDESLKCYDQAFKVIPSQGDKLGVLSRKSQQLRYHKRYHEANDVLDKALRYVKAHHAFFSQKNTAIKAGHEGKIKKKKGRKGPDVKRKK